MIYNIKDDPVPQVFGQEPPMSYRSSMDDREVFDTLIFMLECLSLAKTSVFIYQDDLWYDYERNEPVSCV